MSSNIVKYGSFDLEEAEQDAREVTTKNRYMKLEVGANVIRVLPPADPSMRNPFVKTYKHFVNLTGVERAVVVNCPKRMAKQPCPVCNTADQLHRSPAKADQERARGLWPSLNVLVNVINRNNADSGPVTLRLSKTAYEQILDIRRDAEFGGDFVDPENGFDLMIKRKGQGLQTKYTVTGLLPPSELGNLDWIQQQQDLSPELEVLTAAEIKAKLSGGSVDAAPPPEVIDVESTVQSDVTEFGADDFID